MCVCWEGGGGPVRPWTFSTASHLSEMSTGVTLRVCRGVCVGVGG